MVVLDYKHFPGKSCKTTALSDFMAWNGFYLSEDVVLGLCEGFDFSFILPNEEHHLMKLLVSHADYFENFSKNIGCTYSLITQKEPQIIEDIIVYEKQPVFCEVTLEHYKDGLHTQGQFLNDFSLDFPLPLHISQVIGFEQDKLYLCENFEEQVFTVDKSLFLEAMTVDTGSKIDPHFKIHRFLPTQFDSDAINIVTVSAIKHNMKTYLSSQNPRLGYLSLKLFFETIRQINHMLPEDILARSLKNSGYLIKYVSFGMLRRNYARFLKYVAKEHGKAEGFKKSISQLMRTNYLWNQLANLYISDKYMAYEKINSQKAKALIEELEQLELDVPFLILKELEAISSE